MSGPRRPDGNLVVIRWSSDVPRGASPLASSGSDDALCRIRRQPLFGRYVLLACAIAPLPLNPPLIGGENNENEEKSLVALPVFNRRACSRRRKRAGISPAWRNYAPRSPAPRPLFCCCATAINPTPVDQPSKNAVHPTGDWRPAPDVAGITPGRRL
ncbi:hypothetical protein KCP73_10365 [Salmonella enterica subsp. enterica]|nr:hypothetical protein KCP73_10365 [Salmonella enterica subsp. enterica]